MDKIRTRRFQSASYSVVLIGFTLLSLSCSEQDPAVRQIDELMAYCNEIDEFNGVVLVTRSGVPIYHKAFGFSDHRDGTRNKVNSAFNACSTTKPFVAAGVLLLCEEGRLSLTDNVSSVISPFPYDSVEIRHLLSHTSGIPDYLHHPSYMSMTEQHLPYRRDTGQENASDSVYVVTNADVLKWLRTSGLDLEFEPGRRQKYCNTGYVLLAEIIEEVSGQTLEDFLTQSVLVPAEMTRSVIYDVVKDPRVPNRAYGFNPTLDRKGYELNDVNHVDGILGDGGLYTTTEDLLNFSRAFFGGRILSKAYVDMATSPFILASGDTTSYGFGWITRAPNDERPLTIKHGGRWHGFLTAYAIEPEYDNHIIILTNDAMYPPSIGELEAAISRILHGLPYDNPRFPVSDAIARTIFEEGIDEAIEEYAELKTNHSDRYFFEDRHLNLLGYMLLWEGMVDEAVRILELNAREHPESQNVFDSLGDAYKAACDTARAINAYQQGISLDPSVEHTRRKLEELSVGKASD